jgi:hypothetical protein
MKIYFALWFTFKDGGKTTNVISKNIDRLYELHENFNLDKNCLFHTYKHNISHISVEAIKCYKYDNVNQKIELYDGIEIDDGAFYALNYYPFDNNSPNNESYKEVLIYLSKEHYNQWKECLKNKNYVLNSNNKYPSFFYNELISNIVIPDVYYEDGIMNA